jgi:hypothetical protein
VPATVLLTAEARDEDLRLAQAFVGRITIVGTREELLNALPLRAREPVA